MFWKPIVGGVNTSAEGAWAGTVAYQTAHVAGASCVLVHAVPTDWLPSFEQERDHMADLRAATLTAARQRVTAALQDTVAEEAVRGLEVRLGRPARVLAEVARETDAEVVVLGAKWLRGAGHWVAGATGHDAAHTLDLPTLVATTSAAAIRQILAAVDLSEAGVATIETAHRFATLCGARLRVLHAVEPVPYASHLPSAAHIEELAAHAEEVLRATLWPLARNAGADTTLVRADARGAIRAEVRRWRPDLLVVGSHGGGWVDDLLLGSVTEALLDDLPTSLLIVPTRRLAAPATGHELVAGYSRSRSSSVGSRSSSNTPCL